MTEQTINIQAGRKSPGWGRKNIHFLVAAGILAFAGLGWNIVVGALKWAIYKEPVTWPVGVEVDDQFRLVSLPRQLVGPDGVRYESSTADVNGDGVLDGDNPVRDDTKEILKIGHSTDRARWPMRQSNWFFSRRYVLDGPGDSRTRENWQLDGYYYTGMLDQVPHVPDRCLVAGGAKLVGQPEDVTFHVATDRPEWREIKFRRAIYLVTARDDAGNTHIGQYAQYYAFSVNGGPMSDWRLVRLKLTYPWVRYSYFAKIQFGPLWSIASAEQADAAAERFLKAFLPEVLKALPSPGDVESLRQQSAGR